MADSLFDAYLAGDARAFFAGHFANPADRRRAWRAATPCAPAVVAAIAAQNAALPVSPARDAHLAALQGGALAVVTGQQMGLFLGPLFTAYKAATAVRAARALAQESGQPVVPVFWLQTEDHDLPEIAVNYVPSRSGACQQLQLPAADDVRLSVAQRRLPMEVEACLGALRQEIENLPHAEAHLDRLARAYRAGTGWTEAFAQVLAGLFADEGLVLVNPRDAALAGCMAPVHRAALLQAQPIAAALQERVQALEAAGYSATVHVRPGAPLAFYHPQGAQGPRYRLAAGPQGYAEVGGTGVHTETALLAALDVDPMVFSASALLRPLLQDSLLPTVAYVGGPGEIAYFAQLAPLYASMGRAMPLVVPRARLRLIENKTQRLLHRLGLTAADVALPRGSLLARAVAHGDRAHPIDTAALTQVLVGGFDAALAEVAPGLLAISPDMQASLDKARSGVENAVGKLMQRLERARLHQDQACVADVERLQVLLQPHGAPQERIYGIAYFVARYGERAWLDRVLEAAEPFASAIQDVHL